MNTWIIGQKGNLLNCDTGAYIYISHSAGMYYVKHYLNAGITCYIAECPDVEEAQKIIRKLAFKLRASEVVE